VAASSTPWSRPHSKHVSSARTRTTERRRSILAASSTMGAGATEAGPALASGMVIHAATRAALGLIFGVGGAGAVLGALVAAQWVRHLGIGPAMIVANLLAGLFTLLIPLAGDVPLASVVVLGVAQFAAQMMGAILNINQISIRQVVTPDHLLGRMNAGYRFLTMGMLPVGSFVGGVLGETIGLKATLILGALGMLLPSAWLLLSPLRSLNIEQSNRS
jgi:predicted MFS family arabinose efflux permease